MKTLREKLAQSFAVHLNAEAGYKLTPDELATIAEKVVYGHFRHAALAADRIARDKVPA